MPLAKHVFRRSWCELDTARSTPSGCGRLKWRMLARRQLRSKRLRWPVVATLDNARAHAENRCERLEEGFVRERDRAAVADLVLADLGAQLREEQAMVSEFQDMALGMQAQVDEFVEQYAESTKRVIDREWFDVKKHEQDLVENAEALAWHEESVVTELRREL